MLDGVGEHICGREVGSEKIRARWCWDLRARWCGGFAGEVPRYAGHDDLALGMYRGPDPKSRRYVSFRTSGRSNSGAGISLISSDSGRSSLIFSSWGTTREFQELPIEA